MATTEQLIRIDVDKERNQKSPDSVLVPTGKPAKFIFDAALSTAIAANGKREIKAPVPEGPLTPQMLDKMNRYWRAANYLCIGQIYMFENPLLREPLKPEQIKPRLLGNSNILFPGSLPTFSSYQHFRGQNLVGGWTRVLSSSAINDVRIGYQRDYLSYSCAGCPRPAGTLASFDIVGLTNPLPQFNLYPNVVFQNFPTWGDGFPGYYPVAAPDIIEQYGDTFTKTIGRHTIALGTTWDFWQTKGVTDPCKRMASLISMASIRPWLVRFQELVPFQISPIWNWGILRGANTQKMRLLPTWLAEDGSLYSPRITFALVHDLRCKLACDGSTAVSLWRQTISSLHFFLYRKLIAQGMRSC
jgi:hypothetical protein